MTESERRLNHLAAIECNLVYIMADVLEALWTECENLNRRCGYEMRQEENGREKYQKTMKKKTFEQECEEGRFEFNPNRSFEEKCEIVRRTAITADMTYEERLAMQKARYGL